MNPLCKCPAPGFCERHKIEKSELHWLCCRGECDTLDCGQKFWRAWEIGNLKATPPEEPQPDIDWECNHKVRKPVRYRPDTAITGDNCQVGTRLKKILAGYGITANAGCSCNNYATRMNAMGCDKCEQEIDTIVKWLKKGASERLWLKPLVSLLSGPTDKIARDLVMKAISMERDRIKENDLGHRRVNS